MLPTVDEDKGEAARTRRSDSILALIAAIATLAFAWSGYQSAEWVRERFQRSDEAASPSEDAIRIATEAGQLEARDTILFVEWLITLDADDPETARTVFQLFRPQVQEYLRTTSVDGAGKPDVPPFDSGLYDVAELRSQAAGLDAEARGQSRKSRGASENAARYGALGVLFAGVLAAIGIATRFHERRVRLSLSAVAACLTALGLVLLATSPVSFSI